TDSGTNAYAYCIDVLVTIVLNKQFTPQPWDSSHVGISEADLARINYILHKYPATATVAKGTTNGAIEAAAVQSAIWHFSDGFEINRDGSNDAAVVSQYDTIVADASGHSAAEPPPSLTITPASGSANAGSNVGPFTVATTASGPVALTI